MIERKKIEKALSYAIAIVVCVLISLVFLSITFAEFSKKSMQERQEILSKQRDTIKKFIVEAKPNENLPKTWPPQMNVTYPDMELLDQKGKEFKISDFAGKVLIIEYVDMSSPISQAHSGAKSKGAFGIMQDVDKLAETFEDTVQKNADGKINFPNDNVIQLKIIAYTQDGAQPSRDDAWNWAEHFGFERDNNVIVAISKKDIRTPKTQDIVTGFQLVDKNQKLRVDSSGVAPKHNLKLTLIPLFEKLLRQQYSP